MYQEDFQNRKAVTGHVNTMPAGQPCSRQTQELSWRNPELNRARKEEHQHLQLCGRQKRPSPSEGNTAHTMQEGRQVQQSVRPPQEGAWSPLRLTRNHKKLSQRPKGTLEKSLTRKQLGLHLSTSMRTCVPAASLSCRKFLSGLCWAF